MEHLGVPKSPGDAIADIFGAIGKSRPAAARMTLRYAKHGGSDERRRIAVARRMIFLKGRDSHD